MLKKTAIIITIIFTFINIINAEEKSNLEKKTDNPNISFGVAGTFGMLYPITITGPIKFEPVMSYGGGFIVEKMFNSKAGIHTGLYFSESYGPFSMNFSSFPITAILRAGSITLPVYFIGSLNKSFFSLQMLIGVTLTQYLYAIAYPSSGGAVTESLQNLNPFMAGPGVGLNFKFRTTKFLDFYLGFITTFYFMNFLPRTPDTYTILYDAKVTAGFMFRTNVFPEPEDWRWK